MVKIVGMPMPKKSCKEQMWKKWVNIDKKTRKFGCNKRGEKIVKKLTNC